MAAGEVSARRREDTRHLVSASLIVTSLGLVTKVVSLVTQSVVAALFGANRLLDAMRVVLNVPQLFSTWVEMPVRAAIVPLFTQLRQRDGEEAAWRAASNIIHVLAAVLVGIVLFVVVFAEPIVRLSSLGFRDPVLWAEMARLARIVAISMFFSVLAVVLGSLSNIYRKQHRPAFGRLANGALILAAISLLGGSFGLDAWAWGLVAGSVGAFVCQLPLLWQHRRHYRMVFEPRAKEMKDLLATALPLFIGLTGTRIDVLIDTNFASFLAHGSLSVLMYATFLAVVTTDMLVSVSSTVLLPHFAHLVAEKRFDELRGRLVQALGGYLLVLLPVAAFLIVGARPVVAIFFERGEFTPEMAALTAMLLPILALSAPAFAMGQVLAQVHISGGDTKTPMKVGFWRIGFKVLISASLILPLGIFALAIASTASSYFRTALLWRRLPAERRPAGAPFARLACTLLLSSAIGGGVGAFLLAWLPPFGEGLVPTALRLGVAAGGTFVTHLLVAGLLAPEARAMFTRVLKRGGR